MRGFTILEFLIALSILTLVSIIMISSFMSFQQREALDASVSAISAALRDARTRTMASIDGVPYGVYILSKSFVVFRTSYSSSNPTNEVNLLNPRISASSTPASFTFSRVTGNSSASGTIDVYLTSDPSVKKSINIQSTGLISTQ